VRVTAPGAVGQACQPDSSVVRLLSLTYGGRGSHSRQSAARRTIKQTGGRAGKVSRCQRCQWCHRRAPPPAFGVRGARPLKRIWLLGARHSRPVFEEAMSDGKAANGPWGG